MNDEMCISDECIERSIEKTLDTMSIFINIIDFIHITGSNSINEMLDGIIPLVPLSDTIATIINILFSSYTWIVYNYYILVL